MSRLNCPRDAIAAFIYALAALLAAIIAPPSASAHPESFSNLRFTLAPSAMHVTLILPVRDLTRWFPPGRYKNYTADVVRELSTQTGDLLVVAWDEQPARPSRANVHPGQKGFIIVEEDFSIPAGAGTLAVRSALLVNLPADHQELALVEDARRGIAEERILAEETLSAQQDTFAVDLPAAPSGTVQAAAVVTIAPSISAKRHSSFIWPALNHGLVIAMIVVAVMLLAAMGFSRIARGRDH